LTPTADLRDAYLTLLARSLCGMLYQDESLGVFTEDGGEEQDFFATDVRLAFKEGGSFDEAARKEGRDWPRSAHTMIGEKRLANIRFCVERVLEDGVPGDLIETGVYRGGACIFMKGVLKAHDVTDRRVWLADSFRGFDPNPERYPLDQEFVELPAKVSRFPHAKATPASVSETFERYGLLDDNVNFLVGWFKDTLPDAPIKELAVVRLDGDMYSSTFEALTHLYPRLSVGGYLIVDDYVLSGCRTAVNDFRKAQGINDEIERIDWTGIYWRKS